jgi:hypothetical protein
MALRVIQSLLNEIGFRDRVGEACRRKHLDHIQEKEFGVNMLSEFAAISKAAWDEGLKSISRRILVGMDGKARTSGIASSRPAR